MTELQLLDAINTNMIEVVGLLEQSHVIDMMGPASSGAVAGSVGLLLGAVLALIVAVTWKG